MRTDFFPTPTPSSRRRAPRLLARLNRLVAALGLAACLLSGSALAHDNIPAPAQSQPIVIDGATIHTISGPVIEQGRVRFEQGKLVAVGRDEVSTQNATVIDARGQHLYPGLIAASSVLGLIEIGAVRATNDTAEVGPNNANVRAESAVNPDSELIPVTRANGVLLALSIPAAGSSSVISGTSALLQLEGWNAREMTVAAPIGLHVHWPSSFVPAGFPEERAKAQRQAVKEKRDALQRAFEQAHAYLQAPANALPDLRLEAMRPFLRGEKPVFFHAQDAQSMEEALDFAAQHKLRPVLVGAAEAWRITDRLRATGTPVIISGTHRLPMRRFDPVDALYSNPAKLAAANIDFAIATAGDGFDTTNLRNLPHQAATAAAHGLTPAQALHAITLAPARILGVQDRVGSLDTGKDATLFLADGDILETRTHVTRAWINGREIDLSSRHTRLYDKYRERYGNGE